LKFKATRNYLVLGGSGFIGRNLIQFLLDNGDYVENIDIKIKAKNDLKKLRIKNLKNFDACFFLAWDVGGSKYLTNRNYWSHQYRNNFALISNVLPQFEESKVPFLFISSQLAGTDESPYSVTKFAAENYCKNLRNATIARQWNAYGSVENQSIRSHVVSDFINQAIKTGEIRLTTTGIEQRQFVHMSDICRAYLDMVQVGNGAIFDVSSKKYISILELAEIVADVTGCIVIKGSQIGFDPIVKEIDWCPNWEPRVEIRQGIKMMLDRL
jgi:nucleoside-diphosphate-sugar epimerase